MSLPCINIYYKIWSLYTSDTYCYTKVKSDFDFSWPNLTPKQDSTWHWQDSVLIGCCLYQNLSLTQLMATRKGTWATKSATIHALPADTVTLATTTMQNNLSQPMTAVKFARMVLQELPSGRDSTASFSPTGNQLSSAHSLGIEPIKWETGIETSSLLPHDWRLESFLRKLWGSL